MGGWIGGWVDGWLVGWLVRWVVCVCAMGCSGVQWVELSGVGGVGGWIDGWCHGHLSTFLLEEGWSSCLPCASRMRVTLVHGSTALQSTPLHSIPLQSSLCLSVSLSLSLQGDREIVCVVRCSGVQWSGVEWSEWNGWVDGWVVSWSPSNLAMATSPPSF